MKRLMYVGEKYNAICELCHKSWTQKRKVYQISYPHPAIQSLLKADIPKEICNICAKREEPGLFKILQKEL